MRSGSARRPGDRRSTPRPASSSTTWGCARSRSCRRWKKSRGPCSLSPAPKGRSPRPRRIPRIPVPPIPSRKPQPPAPTAEAKGERLQKLLAAAGLGSRREIEQWIEAGRVSVAGRVAKLGDRALPGDLVSVDGREIRQPAATQPRVLLYHKPVGELVTRRDPQGRRTVFSSLPPGRWVAVGRLDVNSSGLLLLTDSGDLANRLMHPRFEVEREYAARIRGELRPHERTRLLEGVALDGAPARFDRIEIQKKGEGANH